MSAQDLEQRARELLPELPPCADAHAIAAWGPKPDYYTAEQMRDYATSAIAAALRQQPVPVDLEQFREAVECWHDAALPANSVDAERKAEADRLLSIIDNAGKPCPCGEPTCTESWEPGCGLGSSKEHARVGTPAPQQPAPVVDDALADTQRAIIEAAERRGYERAKAEAVVVDDAMVERARRAYNDAQVLNGSDPLGWIRAALTAALARAQGVQS